MALVAILALAVVACGGGSLVGSSVLLALLVRGSDQAGRRAPAPVVAQ